MLLHVVLTSRIARSVKKSICFEVRGMSDADIILRRDYDTYEPDILRAVKDRGDAHRIHSRLNLVGIDLEFVSFDKPSQPTVHVPVKVIEDAKPNDVVQTGVREQPVSGGSESEAVLSESGAVGIPGGTTEDAGSIPASNGDETPTGDYSSRRRKKVV